MIIKANDPQLVSWIDVDSNSDFPIQNIPFGVIELRNGERHCASRIGNFAIDLYALAEEGYIDGLGINDIQIFNEDSLNRFISCGQSVWRGVRNRISELFEQSNSELRDNFNAKSKVLHNIHEVKNLLPVRVGDYTDFYSSIEHATNVGIMFRDPENALLSNWKHIPVGYHGRSSSIVVSGTPIHRPKGQTKADNKDFPDFGSTKLFDFELEMGFIVGKKTELGDSVSTANAEDHIFGMVLFNDLSARDIQRWEYVPLGPFLSKNFGSVASSWIVCLDALEPFRTKGPEQNPEVLPYLQYTGDKAFDIDLEVFLQPKDGKQNKISHSNYKYLYWSMAQQLAHHTVNGCNINVGDLYASGTISGPTEESYGSMLELSWKGTKPLKLADGEERKFIQDFDTITMKAYAHNEKVRIGFGDCVTQILPAK